jgi:hypothetical protein
LASFSIDFFCDLINNSVRQALIWQIIKTRHTLIPKRAPPSKTQRAIGITKNKLRHKTNSSNNGYNPQAKNYLTLKVGGPVCNTAVEKPGN